jgi:hypothetical protein
MISLLPFSSLLLSSPLLSSPPPLSLFSDLVWLVLLGVRSVNRDSWDVVERCQRDQYRDIKHFLILLNTLTQISGAAPEGRLGTEAERAALMTTLEAIDRESYSSPVGNSSHSSSSNTPRGGAPIVGSLRLHQLWHLHRKLLNSDGGEDSLVSYSDGSSSVLKSLDDILMTVFKDESVAYWCLDAIITKFFDARSYIFELKEKSLTPQDIDTLLLSMN